MYRKFLSVLTVLTVFVALFMFSTTNSVNAKSTYKRVSISNVRSTAYHNKSNSGAAYNQSHSRCAFLLKSHPHTSWYVTKKETLRHNRANAVYFYVRSGNKKYSGWVWQQYLTKGGAPFWIKSTHAAAIDVNTGKFLYNKSATAKVPVASTIKLLTIYNVLQKVHSKKYSWNSIVNTSGSGLYNMSRSYACGGFVLKHGVRYTVKQLYQAALIDSSNAAVIALGRWVSGSNVKQVQRMRSQLNSWGLRGNYIVSVSGLDNGDLNGYGYRYPGSSAYAQNTISAHDMAVVARNLLNKYPEVNQTTKINNLKVHGQWVHNVNTTLPGRKYNVRSLYINGLKNGYTPRAGYCLIGSSQKPGHHKLITVVIHDDDMSSDTTALMTHVYKYHSLKN
ncbi:D-alanyl-D-alanine carboxypeptidase [Pediococcus damnosus]|uniref:D-alanyl-D-alanine carboxypeptidase n=1 Tax=Pediococcus damnosus TaxID=51663 RepID=A0A0R2HE11_9LACO|nr:serine hydrolase [Pediococcus damnosus]AMV60117.1 D-alanyl-D-alanine carboxypeptidase [Pediococcus damnosus]AMV62657.1 D-alanyl-D-alanine carboxypeptidase [Pediococcus damnosus]AMV64361.1 D-alanyl-D-alanine carboxypeptidase [Pediococcus damnosus]AMV67461.1 D-alanyl-D-alanine carboxypeptidase [Pediococcus damnosus]AMV69183.1 D-alanyl-D-alanine carboxypeptidase [Pediococcus damnosus]